MSPHLSTEREDQYCQRTLSALELLEVDDHLAFCEECRRRISVKADAETVVSDFHYRLFSTASDHLSYEELVALVDDEIEKTERDELESHLEVCEPCSQDLNDLRSVRVDVLALNEEETPRASNPSFIEKIRLLMDSKQPVFSPAFAVVFALLLIAASVALFFVWRPSTRPRPTLEANNQVPQPQPESTTSANVAAPSPQPALTPDDVITLNDVGVRVTVGGHGEVEGLGPLPVSSIQAVKRALTTGALQVRNLSELTDAKGRLLGSTSDGSTFSLIYPVGTVTRNTRPTLRWEPLMGATSYTVAILDGSYNEITTSPPLTTTSWTPTLALARGRTYSWQVTSSKDGKQEVSPAATESEARFIVLDKATVDELISVEKASKSHLVRGTMYAQAGLLNEAEQEIRSLVAINPDSQKVRQLLQSIRAFKNQYKKNP